MVRESLHPSEEKAIAKVAEISAKAMQPGLWGQQPKQPGCVWAEFIVEDDLPSNLKVGVFQEPKTFSAWIRFSNSRQQDDLKETLYEIAIKLMEVEGEKTLEPEKYAKTQDFLAISHPIFLVKNGQDYAKLFEEISGASDKLLLQFIFSGLNPLKWRLRELDILLGIKVKHQLLPRIISPLEIQYWSSTPYSLGSQAIKFFVKPTRKNRLGKPAGNTKDYLQEEMADFLTRKEACFDFYIQLQTNPLTMPIEDPTVEWKGAEVYKVATIRIPPQIFDSPEQIAFGENLSYTPWHCLPEHRPLGSINRVRKGVYQTLAKTRHELNQSPNQEPTPETFAPELLRVIISP